MLKKAQQFLKEVKIELKKVSWPNRRQLIESTIVVVSSVLIIAVFIGIVDISLSKLLTLILR